MVAVYYNHIKLPLINILKFSSVRAFIVPKYGVPSESLKDIPQTYNLFVEAHIGIGV